MIHVQGDIAPPSAVWTFPVKTTLTLTSQLLRHLHQTQALLPADVHLSLAIIQHDRQEARLVVRAAIDGSDLEASYALSADEPVDPQTVAACLLRQLDDKATSTVALAPNVAAAERYLVGRSDHPSEEQP